MECCNSISDYRYNGVNSTNYHYPYGYHSSSVMRHQHASNYRNNVAASNGGGAGGGMTYDRYNPSYNYNNGPYGYNSNSTNQYYSNLYPPHESYKHLNPTNHLQQSYHHRELYGDNEQAMYRSRHMIRDQSYHHYADFPNNSSATSNGPPMSGM